MLARMKKWLRFIAWIGGMAVFLLLTAHFTLRHALNTPKFKAAATGFVERATGRAAEYERIDYTLFPFALVVRNAALKEQDGARDFASMAEFALVVDFKTKEIASIRMEEPAIRIVQRPDGTFNFSDLMAPAPAAATPGAAAKPAGPKPAAGPAAPAAPPIVLRLVQIEKARFEFVRADAAPDEEPFTISNLDFELRDFAPDRPFRMDGRAAIGKSSAAQFELSGPALEDYADNLGAWPVAFGARLDIRDFADLKAFLPKGAPPCQGMEATLNIQGALADKLHILLNLKTPAATEAHPVALELALDAEASLPGPVLQHLLAGAPLPAEFQFAPPPCEPPPGGVSPANDPVAGLLLKHAQAKADLAFPRIAYGQNLFENGAATVFLRGGTLTIPNAKLAAYGGTIEARGNVQLLACPLTYKLERLAAKDLAIEQALAANGLGDLATLSGALQLEAMGGGHAVAGPGLNSLEADVRAHIDRLQTVGTGGSLMDRVWLELDNPLLPKLMPRLKSKVEQAQRAADNVTTQRYDEAAAVLSLRNGIATLSEARLSMAGYRLEAAGPIRPFDDQIDLAARLLVSPEETLKLTDGKDRSDYLPYENGGLMVPLFVRGPLHEPEVRPDYDRLLQHALAGVANEDLGAELDKLSDSDKKHVQEGLKLLQGLGDLF